MSDEGPRPTHLGRQQRPQRDGDGREVIGVVTEEDYFRWMFTKAAASRSSFPQERVWVEGGDEAEG